MSLSKEIIRLLRALEDAELTIEFAIDAVEQSDILFPKRSARAHQNYLEAVRAGDDLTSTLAKAKMRPIRKLNQEVIETFMEIVGDEGLDSYFTALALEEVPRVVDRWKKLRAVQVILLPGEKVSDYLRQAITCYLYGLPNAAAILCRAVLQFALEDELAKPGGMSLDLMSKLDRKDYIEYLINFSRMRKVLSPELAIKAHNVRKVGNNSIHKSNCPEPKALASIKETGEILSHIYGRTGTSAR